jgi:hypothetical protein
MDPESGSGDADRGKTAKPIRARFCWVHGYSLTLRISAARTNAVAAAHLTDQGEALLCKDAIDDPSGVLVASARWLA